MQGDKDIEIFNAIVEIVTQQEFQKAQDQFMEKNADQFEDTDENKLSYTNIYHDYVHLLD